MTITNCLFILRCKSFVEKRWVKGQALDPLHTDTTAIEREIDRLVYDLYGLTEDEIRIVETTK